MSIAELKTDLIRYVIEMDNPTLLEKAINYFKKLQEQDDWWDKLTTEQQQFIEESAKQIDEGKVVSNDQVRSEINQLLQKK